MTEVEVPKQHKACVYDNPGHVSVKVETVDTPEPGPGEVLVNLTHSGVCHSDLAVMTNAWVSLPHPTPKNQVGGHEGVGTIVKLGSGAEASGRKVGDRVGIKWVSRCCGSCDSCMRGMDGVCLDQAISGYYTPGTYQQYVLGPASYVTPIPDSLDSAAAAPFLCAGVTTYAALKRSGARPGQWVAIPGAGGGLGHLAVQIASRGMGLRVIGIDVGDKAQFVEGLGAEAYFDLKTRSEDELVKAVQEKADGLGVHGVVVCSGAMAAYETSMKLMRRGGVLVCVGMPEGATQGFFGAFPTLLAGSMKSIVGSAVGNRAEAVEVLQMAARGVVKTAYRTEPMEKLQGILEDMRDGKLTGRVVLELK